MLKLTLLTLLEPISRALTRPVMISSDRFDMNPPGASMRISLATSCVREELQAMPSA